MKVYLASFPNDCWGYFGTRAEAERWIDLFRKHKESLYDLPPSKDGAHIEEMTFFSLSAFCIEVNGSLRAGWVPDEMVATSQYPRPGSPT